MRCYAVLPTEFDCSVFGKKTDFFKIGEPVLYSSIDEIVAQKSFDPNKHFIVELEFTNQKQIMNAVMSAYMGNAWKEFDVVVLSIISQQTIKKTIEQKKILEAECMAAHKEGKSISLQQRIDELKAQIEQLERLQEK